MCQGWAVNRTLSQFQKFGEDISPQPRRSDLNCAHRVVEKGSLMPLVVPPPAPIH